MNNYTRKISIPVPNTRFILNGRQKEDTSWDIAIYDPQEGIEKSCKKDVSNSVFGLLSSIVLKTEIE